METKGRPNKVVSLALYSRISSKIFFSLEKWQMVGKQELLEHRIPPGGGMDTWSQRIPHCWLQCLTPQSAGPWPPWLPTASSSGFSGCGKGTTPVESGPGKMEKTKVYSLNLLEFPRKLLSVIPPSITQGTEQISSPKPHFFLPPFGDRWNVKALICICYSNTCCKIVQRFYTTSMYYIY